MSASHSANKKLLPLNPARTCSPEKPSLAAQAYRGPRIETHAAQELRAQLTAVRAATGFIPSP
jgi:hypothetical protein